MRIAFFFVQLCFLKRLFCLHIPARHEYDNTITETEAAYMKVTACALGLLSCCVVCLFPFPPPLFFSRCQALFFSFIFLLF